MAVCFEADPFSNTLGQQIQHSLKPILSHGICWQLIYKKPCWIGLKAYLVQHSVFLFGQPKASRQLTRSRECQPLSNCCCSANSTVFEGIMPLTQVVNAVDWVFFPNMKCVIFVQLSYFNYVVI